jgi:hypothetical protein
MQDKAVMCDTHGEQQATFVCQHIVQSLQDGKARGFWTADNPDNPRPDAWCTECEAVVQQNNGQWDEKEEEFAKVTLLCGACYDKVIEINAGIINQ